MQFRIIARHDVSEWDEWKSHFRKYISPVVFKIHRCVVMFKQKKFVFWVNRRLKGSPERGSERVWDDKGIHLHISTVAELQTAGGMYELGTTWIVNIPSHMGMWVRLEKTVTYFVYRKVGNTQCLFGTTQGTPVCEIWGEGHTHSDGCIVFCLIHYIWNGMEAFPTDPVTVREGCVRLGKAVLLKCKEKKRKKKPPYARVRILT